MGMSAATIDRRLAVDRARLSVRGGSHTKPGSLLKSQIPIRTWAHWDDQRPGFVEIDLVGHDGGSLVGELCFSLTVTDIATGWTQPDGSQQGPDGCRRAGFRPQNRFPCARCKTRETGGRVRSIWQPLRRHCARSRVRARRRSTELLLAKATALDQAGQLSELFDQARVAGVLLTPLQEPLDAAHAVLGHGRPASS